MLLAQFLVGCTAHSSRQKRADSFVESRRDQKEKRQNERMRKGKQFSPPALLARKNMALGTSLLSTWQGTPSNGRAAAIRLPRTHFEGVTAKAEIGGLDLVEHLAPRWERLCEETSSLPFYRPEWIAAYLKAFEPDSQVVLMTARAGDKLVAVLPLTRKRAWFAGVPVWKLAGAANIHSTQFDIVRTSCDAGEAAIPAFWNLLKGIPGWNMLELPLLSRNSVGLKLIKLASKDGCRTMSVHFSECPVLSLKRDEKGQLTWLQDTSRHFRHELRRCARILTREMGEEPKLVRRTNPDREALEQFYELEASGWKGREGSAIKCTPQTRSFYNQISQEAAARGYFCLHSLEVNNRMLAGAFSVQSADCLYPLKIAYDESLRRGGPGQVMFDRILNECARRGITRLFFGGRNDAYKMKWTNETLSNFNGFVFSPDFRSKLAFRLRTLHPGIRRPQNRIQE
jgi:CelD/BcsL family acetyltransferase involved in cellulose biosynthesis